MAKLRKALDLTTEEVNALTEANIVLERIQKVLDAEGTLLGDENIKYPNILDEIYGQLDKCFF